MQGGVFLTVWKNPFRQASLAETSEVRLKTRTRLSGVMALAVTVTAPLFAQNDALTELLTGAQDEAQIDSGRLIDTDTSAADDEKVRLRLSNIFSEFDDLDQVSVSVSNSVANSGRWVRTKCVNTSVCMAIDTRRARQ